jgi:single-strand selective monofunctional uracil DNA glycosylase
LNRKALVKSIQKLSRQVDGLSFKPPVTHVYNPLGYAWETHEQYLTRYAGEGQILLVGMNPGPFGMAQTGVPFGDISSVRDWLGIMGGIGQPPHVHPKRPVQGFSCPRSEVSGRRLWGWAQERFGSPERFFRHFFILNYCPLAFMEETGRNRTPDKLAAEEREALFRICDRSLREVSGLLRPSLLVGIGVFAQKRAQSALPGHRVERILHPSPASPLANRGWAAKAEEQLSALGLDHWT